MVRAPLAEESTTLHAGAPARIDGGIARGGELHQPLVRLTRRPVDCWVCRVGRVGPPVVAVAPLLGAVVGEDDFVRELDRLVLRSALIPGHMLVLHLCADGIRRVLGPGLHVDGSEGLLRPVPGRFPQLELERESLLFHYPLPGRLLLLHRRILHSCNACSHLTVAGPGPASLEPLVEQLLSGLPAFLLRGCRSRGKGHRWGAGRRGGASGEAAAGFLSWAGCGCWRRRVVRADGHGVQTAPVGGDVDGGKVWSS